VSYRHKSLSNRRPRRKLGAKGFSLIETIFAMAILLIAVAGLLPPFLIATAQNETQGNLATRATELSQDKMEGLMALPFADPGLGGAMGASSTVGSVPPAAPVTNYVDYLDSTGGTATATTWFYKRQWKITVDATATLKTITVVATARNASGSLGLAPSTTVVCFKSSGL
jgi:prepilin-type N-terminal cleavage/methylation domain-containing protein